MKRRLKKRLNSWRVYLAKVY